jgi:hypothetical protein
MTIDFIIIFVYCDDFCKAFFPYWEKRSLNENSKKTRRRSGKLNLSEIITILIGYHYSGFNCFKNYYLDLSVNNPGFDSMPHYDRFVAIAKKSLVILYYLLKSLRGKKTNLQFIDSTKLPVCDNARINNHKIFDCLASRSKTSTGWFFGLKLHLIINDYGEIMNIIITQGNVVRPSSCS